MKDSPKSVSSSIASVRTNENSIIIDFNKNITKNDIKFFELHSGNLYKDVFDIDGAFEHAYETKLHMNKVKKITVGQFKPNTLRISIAHDFNLKTIYIINKRQIIIKILDLDLKEKLSSSLEKNFFRRKNESSSLTLVMEEKTQVQ